MRPDSRILASSLFVLGRILTAVLTNSLVPAERGRRARPLLGLLRRLPPRPAAAAAAPAGEALVVAHHELRVDLVDQVEADADGDQDAGAADHPGEAAPGDAERLVRELRQQRDHGE